MDGRMTSCCGPDHTPFSPFPCDEALDLCGNVYTFVGFHKINDLSYVCLENVSTGIRMDYWVTHMDMDLDTGVATLIPAMLAISRAAK
jgi:hypothetical protein